MMKLVTLVLAGALITNPLLAIAQNWQDAHPGIAPYTPSRIEWLGLDLNTQLRMDNLAQDGFMLSIVQSGPETLTIFVRYLPTVRREQMNQAIDTARRVIAITAKSYHWDSWLQVKEDVQMGHP